MMNVRVQEALHTLKNKRVIVTALAVFAFIQLVFSVKLVADTLNYDKIYKGIYINDVYVSGMTQNEAKELLEQTYRPRFENMRITMKANDVTESVNPERLVNSLKIEEAVENAYNEGREGNFFSRIQNISNVSIHGKGIKIQADFDEARVQQLIGKFSLKLKKELIQNTYQISEDKILIKFGQTGESIDEGALRQRLTDQISSFEDGELDIPIQVVQPNPINVDQLHKEVYTLAKDAKYEVKNHRLSIIPHVIGRDFDVVLARKTIESEKKEGGSTEIPLKLSYPKVYEDALRDSLFNDKLSTFTTRYNQGDKSRSENVRLAASKINGTVLAPGGTFSYNEVVGERTVDEGYQTAHVYVQGKIVDGIGGGICQVSTTLYNSTLLANLEIVERRNHNMIVGYVSPGRDATVSYGSTDFKFKNNTGAPIKILTSSGGGSLKIDILGTNEHPGRKVEIQTEKLATYPYTEKVIEDPTQPVGYYKVIQNGMNGYKVDTYKIIKENGRTVSKTKISTSRYNTLQKIVKKGTKKTASAPSTDAAQQ